MNELSTRTWIARSELALGPVRLRLLESEVHLEGGARPDGILQADWRGRQERFIFESKGLSTPKSVETAVAQVLRYAAISGLEPMIVVPYLAESQLTELERIGVSGLDLNGNGVLVTPEIAVWRSGFPNAHREPTSLRNPYAGDSSIFVRSFLIKGAFPSLTELQRFAESRTLRRSGPDRTSGILRLGTASKAVRALTEDLSVKRDEGGLRLLDGKRLMNRLKAGYRPDFGRTKLGKTPLDPAAVWRRVREGGLRAVATGVASAEAYGLLSGVERQSLYVDDLELAGETLEVKEGRAFANIELIESTKQLPFFDYRERGDERWASPVQTWLELTGAGPREQEAAQGLSRALAAGEGETIDVR